MTNPQDLGAIARSIIDSNRYMTLGTADANGLPWTSPVWYAPAEYREFFWVSAPDARHSRNLASRPQLAIVIFDSHCPGGWHAVYMSAVAEELAGLDVDEGIEVFSRRSEAQGMRAWTRDAAMGVTKQAAHHKFARAWIDQIKAELKAANATLKTATREGDHELAATAKATRDQLIAEIKRASRKHK